MRKTTEKREESAVLIADRTRPLRRNIPVQGTEREMEGSVDNQQAHLDDAVRRLHGAGWPGLTGVPLIPP